MNYELVRQTEEDLGGKIPVQFAAERARDGDRLEQKLGDGQLGAPRFRNLA
jgi:hypothetical protein